MMKSAFFNYKYGTENGSSICSLQTGGKSFRKLQQQLCCLMILLSGCLLSSRSMGQGVRHISLDTMQAKKLSELITRRTVSGENGTFGLFTMQKSAVVPLHQHISEQYTFILKGSVRVTIKDSVYIVKAGDCILIPANVPHLFEALEDNTLDLDFFAPKRIDWINGTDNYFKK